MVGRSAASKAVERANETLARLGFPYRGDAEELIAWLQTDTPYPNPPDEELLRNPHLVIHEIVEIAEVKRKGLRITKDVIMRNMEAVNDAHLRAAEVEFQAIAAAKDVAFLRSRYDDLCGWCEDPLLTPDQRAAYEALREKTEGALKDLERLPSFEGERGKGR